METLAHTFDDTADEFEIEFNQDEAERLEELGYRMMINRPEVEHIAFNFEATSEEQNLSTVTLQVYRDGGGQYIIAGTIDTYPSTPFETEPIERRQGTFPYAPK